MLVNRLFATVLTSGMAPVSFGTITEVGSFVWRSYPDAEEWRLQIIIHQWGKMHRQESKSTSEQQNSSRPVIRKKASEYAIYVFHIARALY